MERFNGVLYQIPDTLCRLVGDSPQQIINTLKFYKHRGPEYHSWKKAKTPSEAEIKDVEDVCISCALPLAKIYHNIEVKVRENFSFEINANAFDWVKKQAKVYEELKRVDLFKFIAGAPVFGLWFLPEQIMEDLRNYDWDQHQRQINTWLAQREVDLDDAERMGFLYRKRD